MKRGDLVILTLAGDFGKPRPALVVQSDLFNQEHPTITVAPLTSTIGDRPLFRLTVEPGPGNGLRVLSQIMIDKMNTIRRAKIGRVIGHLDEVTMQRVNRAAAMWLGLAA
jgi:mRNA interferase MazF